MPQTEEVLPPEVELALYGGGDRVGRSTGSPATYDVSEGAGRS